MAACQAIVVVNVGIDWLLRRQFIAAGLSTDALRLPNPPLAHPLAQNPLAASQLAMLLNQGLQQQAQANQGQQVRHLEHSTLMCRTPPRGPYPTLYGWQ